MPGLVEHLERHLGAIDVGWTRGADGAALPFSVVRFAKGSGPGTVAFCTLGLSRHALRSRTSDRSIRHELLMLVPESLRDGPVPGILQQVGSDALGAHTALLRGDVLGPRGPLLPGSELEALYVAIPVYLPEEFAGFEENGQRGVVAWLVPISAREAGYVADHGWESFEDRLVEADPDLTDPGRPSLPL